MGFARSGCWRIFPAYRFCFSKQGIARSVTFFPSSSDIRILYIDTSTYVAHRQLESFVDKFGPGAWFSAAVCRFIPRRRSGGPGDRANLG